MNVFMYLWSIIRTETQKDMGEFKTHMYGRTELAQTIFPTCARRRLFVN